MRDDFDKPDWESGGVGTQATFKTATEETRD